MGDNSCVVCGHREAADGYVCDPDITRLTEQLAGIGGKIGRLRLALAPSAAALSADRVQVARVHPGLPARLDALSLLGPGSDRLSAAAMTGMLHPWVRRWRTVETLTVSDVDGDRECEIVTWHQEIADHAAVTYSTSHTLEPETRPAGPGMVAALHDDQVGLVPPGAWAAAWARRWRRRLGQHQRPVRYARGADGTQEAANRYIRYHLNDRDRQKIAATVLGIRPAAADRPDDPLDEHWQRRFGLGDAGNQLAQDLNYLTRSLPSACRSDFDIAAFAGELRALSEELTRVVGDQPDQYWLGRCPTELTNRDTGATRRCGAGIWQDPYASQVKCLRCRTAWGPAKSELIGLAIAIRRTWPADRRRRYTAAEIRSLPPLPCPTCTATVQVRWKEVTARHDPHRTWQPTTAVCPSGCDTSRLV